jgi:hypothetical protein
MQGGRPMCRKENRMRQRNDQRYHTLCRLLQARTNVRTELIVLSSGITSMAELAAKTYEWVESLPLEDRKRVQRVIADAKSFWLVLSLSGNI